MSFDVGNPLGQFSADANLPQLGGKLNFDECFILTGIKAGCKNSSDRISLGPWLSMMWLSLIGLDLAATVGNLTNRHGIKLDQLVLLAA